MEIFITILLIWLGISALQLIIGFSYGIFELIAEIWLEIEELMCNK